MNVKQLSVFIENNRGSLASFCDLLGQNDVDLIALSIADTTNFGVLRTIVSDTDKALALVRGAGYAVSVTEVLAVAVPDEPGGLAGALKLLNDNNLSIENVYSFVRNVGGNAVIIFRMEYPDRAGEVLSAAGIRLLTQDEVRHM